MFTPFYTTKEIGKGTGLGLGLSKEIIDKHNGRLYVDKEAENTTFIIELHKKEVISNNQNLIEVEEGKYKQAS